jgi:16S rRNA processing protein RimM
VDKAGFLPIGKCVGVHGIKGVLKVRLYTESLSLFDAGKELFCAAVGNERQAVSDPLIPYRIQWSKPHKQGLLLCLKDICDCNQAERLKGYEFFIRRASLPDLEEGTYYWADLIGLSVFTQDESPVGSIEAVLPTGSNDVYVVRDKDREILIPALESVVVSVDLKAKIMRVKLPEGL